MPTFTFTNDDERRIASLLTEFDSKVGECFSQLRNPLSDDDRNYAVALFRKEAEAKFRGFLVREAVRQVFEDYGIGTQETREAFITADGFWELFTAWSDPRIQEIIGRDKPTSEEADRFFAIYRTQQEKDYLSFLPPEIAQKKKEKLGPLSGEEATISNEAFKRAHNIALERLKEEGLFHFYSAEGSVTEALDTLGEIAESVYKEGAKV